MNKRGGYWLAWVTLSLVLLITLSATISPLMDSLNTTRQGTALNCPDVSDFNSTRYDAQNSFEKLVYRPTCFVTGLSILYWVFSVLIAIVMFAYSGAKK